MREIEPLDFPRYHEGPVPGDFPDDPACRYEEEAALDEDSTILEEKVRTVARGDKALKFGIVASVVLHAFFVCAMPRVMNPGPSRAEQRQEKREPVTKVRLVEFKSPPKEEPPPEQASAVSDRDHTAVREKIPKRPPNRALTPVETPHPDGRLASLHPGVPPKEAVKHEEAKAAKNRKVEKKAERPKKDKVRVTDLGKLNEPTDQELRDKSNVDIRPTMEDFRKGLFGGDAASDDYCPEGELEEAVLDINTRNERFFSYLLHLKQKIEAVWIYPKVASSAGLGGDLTVEFTLSKDGRLVGIGLLDSTGNQILDDAALNAIKDAAPYLPFPPRLKTQRLKIRAKFIYVTTTRFGKVM